MRFTYWLKKKRFYLFLILIALIYFFSDSYFDSSVLDYVSIESKAYFESLINETIKDEILDSSNGKFVELEFDSEGKVSYAYVNAHKALEVKNKASIKLEELLAKIEKKKNLTNMEIPIGYFFTKMFFLTNGLRVPVKLKVYNAHDVDVVTTVEEYGINSSLFEIHLIISLDTFVQIPFQRKRINLESDILLAVEIINSEIPEVYLYNGKLNDNS